MTMFSQWKARDLKWNLDISWMTEVEAAAFNAFRKSGEISSFRISYCQGEPLDKDEKPVKCTNEVPTITDDQGQQVKLYCSRRCHDSKVIEEDK